MGETISKNKSSYLRDIAYFLSLSIFMSVSIFILSFYFYGRIIFNSSIENNLVRFISLIMPFLVPISILSLISIYFGLPFGRYGCNECGYPNRPGKHICKNCGSRFQIYKREYLFMLLLSVSSVLGLILIFVLIHMLYGPPSKRYIVLEFFSAMTAVLTPPIVFGVTYLYRTSHNWRKPIE